MLRANEKSSVLSQKLVFKCKVDGNPTLEDPKRLCLLVVDWRFIVKDYYTYFEIAFQLLSYKFIVTALFSKFCRTVLSHANSLNVYSFYFNNRDTSKCLASTIHSCWHVQTFSNYNCGSAGGCGETEVTGHVTSPVGVTDHGLDAVWLRRVRVGQGLK